MPPKNKGAGKKTAKTRTPTLIDGLTKDEMSKEQLEEHIVRIQGELDIEREEINYLQRERDNIHTYWESTDRQLEEVKAKLQNVEKEIEMDEAQHQVKIKVYKQKMKHLLCEHQNTVTELKAESLVSTEVLQNEQEQLEDELHKGMIAVMVEMQQLDNENLLKELEMKHNEEITQARIMWEKLITEIKSVYDDKLKMQQQKLDNMRKKKIHEREDQWNLHIAGLIEDHNTLFKKTEENISLIQQDIQDISTGLSKMALHILEGKVEKKREKWKQLLKENKGLTECLSTLNEEIAEKEKKMKYYTMREDNSGKIKKKELNDLKLENQDLEQKFNKLQLKNDEWNKKSIQRIEKVQHKADLQTMQLENKVKTLTDTLEKTQAQLHLVLSTLNMDQMALCGITKKFEETLEFYSNCIKDFQYKKSLILKKTDLLRSMAQNKPDASRGDALSLARKRL
ncbi:dynein regulatory complex subunit 4-like [Echeneis naucrates]|uniref:dynein regulatory complex subunit 4-like n=1 Tax=Echeneis naucrates TaxID=173247 RepID=UPI0011138B80|nr:dynein regulatory complex subunit 4-like [Echeneis naucrates]